MIRALPFVLYSNLVLAHPGHGKPGFLHSHELLDHSADGALIFGGILVLAMACWRLFRTLKR